MQRFVSLLHWFQPHLKRQKRSIIETEKNWRSWGTFLTGLGRFSPSYPINQKRKTPSQRRDRILFPFNSAGFILPDRDIAPNRKCSLWNKINDLKENSQKAARLCFHIIDSYIKQMQSFGMERSEKNVSYFLHCGFRKWGRAKLLIN